MQEYFLGLDMGTNSVGWAVTDSQYNIIRKKGKDLWGIREFDEASSASERRTHRIARRNHQRSLARIGLLKSFFSEAIDKEDEAFYQRLENSFFSFADGDKPENLETKYAIFADDDYTDKDYYEEYPTIFKLKLDLINDSVPYDSRYTRKVFLALLNYFKHRGHFLNESLSDEGEVVDVFSAFDNLAAVLEENLDMDFSIPEDKKKEILDVFTGNYSRTLRTEKLAEIIKVDKKSKQYLVIKAITGLKVDLCKLFDTETEKKAEIDFSSAGVEEKLPEIYLIIGMDYAEVIEGIKAVYDAGLLCKTMTGAKWLSEARVRDYEKHKADLALLKKCIRKYCGLSEYDFMFRSNEDGTYSAYIGSVNSDTTGKKRRGEQLHKSKSGERYANFRKRIKNDLEPYKEKDEDVKRILFELDNETFLPKQLTFANGIIPNQLHAREVKRILENASKYLKFLNETDETGLTVSEKIYRLFTFQIPYYVGPLSQNYKGNGWAVRREGRENEKILPWTIDEVIDFGATQKKFIKRLIRECSYISGEKVLPKESMEYQAYMVLNSINCIKIRNEKISVKLKQDIYHDLFEKKNNVTKKDILKYLCNRGYVIEESELSGIDETIGCNLSTYRRFIAIVGENVELDSYKAMIEKIVYYGTIYGNSKKLLKELIQSDFSKDLTEEQIKRVLGFKYKDWGKLSAEFLNLLACNKETGEQISLIRAMWEDNLTLMELINSDKYTFNEVIKDKRKKSLKTLSDFTFEDLEGMYYSAPVKRMIWQTILIIKEIESVMGSAPLKVFVETTRHDEEKGDLGRKNSREKELLDLYKAIKDDRSWDEEIKEAGGSGSLRSKKLYLYYKQMGFDMYTGDSILLSMVNREIVLNGYSTKIGIFHNNADNPFNLGSDMMEPFRVLVDRVVKADIPKKFETAEKRKIMELFNGEVLIDGRKEYIPNAVKIYVRSVFEAINDNDISEIKFYRYEL